MKINPQQARRNLLFYNNICFIIVCFSILYFFTSILLGFLGVKTMYYSSNNSLFGPIEVGRNNQIYEITAKFRGSNSSTVFSGSILDRDKDVIYEFEKELWHESGYDSEGYWSESDDYVKIPITFPRNGTYYIEFDNVNVNSIYVNISKKTYSNIPHLKFGSIFLLITLIVWIYLNLDWVKIKLEEMEENIEYD